MLVLAKQKECNHVLKASRLEFPNHVELYKACEDYKEAFSLVMDLRSKNDGNYYWIGNIEYYTK